MGILDYIVLALVVAGIIAAIAYIKKHKNDGCRGCMGDCSTCEKKRTHSGK